MEWNPGKHPCQDFRKGRSFMRARTGGGGRNVQKRDRGGGEAELVGGQKEGGQCEAVLSPGNSDSDPLSGVPEGVVTAECRNRPGYRESGGNSVRRDVEDHFELFVRPSPGRKPFSPCPAFPRNPGSPCRGERPSVPRARQGGREKLCRPRQDRWKRGFRHRG